MKIGVCMKRVADTETRVRVAGDGKAVDLADVSFIISPYDEYAIEEAIRIKEKNDDAEVILFCVDNEDSVKVIRNGLAMGADRAMLINDPTIRPDEPFAVAQALAGALAAEQVTLALFGKHGVGQDYHQVPALVAEILGWPQVAIAVKLELDGENLMVHREIEGGEEVVECRLPAVISAQKGLNEPRYPSLKGIMQAKKKPLDTRTLADLGLDPLSAASWEVVKVELPPPRQAGKILEGEPEEQVRRLVELLHSEAKVI
ncbi:MAG: electron transfer flavoprotein subunit beta/FixA family protein [Acidobacteria bacterium]|nr:electron transfer flavoprotein subunit beta/FixA family protein [Acidobacteriota bacterium]